MRASSVRYVVNNNYDKPKKKRGPKFKITSSEKIKIKKELKNLKNQNQKVTAKKIKTNCNIDTNIRTIQRSLSKLGFGY